MASKPVRKVDILRDDDLIELYSAILSAKKSFEGETSDTFEEIEQIRCPTIVLTGSQSMGKTTFIESLLKFQVGPTAQGTATRCPVRYILRAGDERSYSVGSRRLNSREDVRTEVANKTTDVGGQGNGFSSIPIEVNIVEPGIVNLDITDLPGLKADGGKDSDEIQKIVRHWLTKDGVVPVVITKAAESAETHSDIRPLVDCGLKLNEAIVVVNHMNVSLKSHFSVRTINEYFRSYCSSQQFRECLALRFVMLHPTLHMPTNVDTDRMNPVEYERFYNNLPEAELNSLRAHIEQEGVEGSWNELEDAALKQFGVVNAHSALLDVLRVWTRKNGNWTAQLLNSKVLPLQEEQRRLDSEIAVCQARKDQIKQNIGKYADKYTSQMKALRRGDTLKVKPSIIGAPRDKRPKSESMKVTHTYVKEVSLLHADFRDAPVNPFSVWRPVNELETELPAGSSLKRKLGMALSCDAAINRLVEVVSYQIMRRPLKRYTEEEIENRIPIAEQFINRGDTTNVVRKLVSENLDEVFCDELQGAIPRLIEHLRILVHGPVDKIHDALQGEFKDVSALQSFKDELDDGFGTWLDKALTTCKDQLLETVGETEETLVVNIDKMFYNLIEPHMMKPESVAQTSQGLTEGTEEEQDIPQVPAPPLSQSPVTGGELNLAPDVSRILRFLEAGPPNLLKEDVNDSATKYFDIYKGMLVLEMQSKVRKYVQDRLSLGNGPDDPLVVKITEVADQFRREDHSEAFEDILGTSALEDERDARKTQIHKIKEVVHTLRQKLRTSAL